MHTQEATEVTELFAKMLWYRMMKALLESYAFKHSTPPTAWEWRVALLEVLRAWLSAQTLMLVCVCVCRGSLLKS